jgi:hypothetical protein
MKKNLILLAVFLIALHVMAIIESCGPDCDNQTISLSAERLEVSVFSNIVSADNSTTQHKRETINLNIRLEANDSYLSSLSGNRLGILSSAYANGDCAGDYRVIKESIKEISILKMYDENGTSINQNITKDFVAQKIEGDGLYEGIETALGDKTRKYLLLAYKEIAKGDSLGLIVNARLSDDRILSDTLNFYLK